jgi:hypothetical protein
MLLPTTLPMAMPGWPEKAALKHTKSSGAEVPKATTVSPTTIGGIAAFFARAIAPRTSRSPASRR